MSNAMVSIILIMIGNYIQVQLHTQLRVTKASGIPFKAEQYLNSHQWH